jgi:NitT/TauT family transport system substrate-binding protein
MKRLLTAIVAALVLFGCGESYEETKRITRAQRLKLMREDSAALKVAVMPTLDCLPVYVAKDRQMFDTVVDIRLKPFMAQMDVDTALLNRRVEVGVTDLVRAERMKAQGAPLKYLSATNAYWLLLANRTTRITDLKHLDDRMLAMTRYSATDLLGDVAVDSAKLKHERVFRIQINDVYVRLKMLENNEMDALLLTEPQATQAIALKSKVLLDTRKMDVRLGALVVRTDSMGGKDRQRQVAAFCKGYNAACDSINKYGLAAYSDLIVKHCKVTEAQAALLPKDLKFYHIAAPRDKDVAYAAAWLKKKK